MWCKTHYSTRQIQFKRKASVPSPPGHILRLSPFLLLTSTIGYFTMNRLETGEQTNNRIGAREERISVLRDYIHCLYLGRWERNSVRWWGFSVLMSANYRNMVHNVRHDRSKHPPRDSNYCCIVWTRSLNWGKWLPFVVDLSSGAIHVIHPLSCRKGPWIRFSYCKLYRGMPVIGMT